MEKAKANGETKTKSCGGPKVLAYLFSGAVAMVTAGLRRVSHTIQSPQRAYQQLPISFFRMLAKTVVSWNTALCCPRVS